MPDTMATPEAAPAAVVAALEKNLSHQLLKKVTAGNAAYHVVLQYGEEEGSLVVVREAPGSTPEVVAVDTSPATPGGGGLPKEVTDALEAILGKPDADEAGAVPAVRSEGFAALEAASPAPLTPERLRQLLLAEAQKQDGHLNSRDAEGTQQGRLACAWAVNKVAQMALGRPIGGALSVLAMRRILRERHHAVPEARATGGTIIVSCAESGDGHVGIVGEPASPGRRRVYSNSSKRALWMHNYTLDSWEAYFHGQRGFPVEFFDLDPAYFRPGSHSYPGELTVGSRGEDVRTLQNRLTQLGFKVEADGDFGKATYQAVVAFQKKAKLELQDGIVGPKTWAALWA